MKRSRIVSSVLALTLLAGAWWWSSGEAREGAHEASASADSEPSFEAPSPRALPASAQAAPPAREESADDDRGAQLQLWTQRLERAEQTLATYRQATKYPPDSRPAREHPDQMTPAAPEREIPFESDDGESSLVLVLGQDRVFLSGDEVVTLSVRCADRRGDTQRCTIAPGSAHEPVYVEGAGSLEPVPVPFRDDGQQGDPTPSDGQYTARFAPARSGFLTYSGTLRIDVEATAGSSKRRAFFDVLYTGSPPARFTRTTDSLENGSLHFDVGLEVARPGRYVVTGRVDDASGAPFAWVQFNEELGEGKQKARLTVFGRLIREERPTFPLQLRDVEGFRLLEQGDPDRELIPMLSGVVHRSGRHSLESFTETEWESDQRTRYLEEMERDVERAKQEVNQLRQ